MSKKEELAKEYSFNIPSEVYNTLETDADKLLWKTETERAFEAGWDAAIDKALKWIKENIHFDGCKDSRLGWQYFDGAEDAMVEDFKEAMNHQ